eukprot:866229-Ditylum_brightwellii.AAC.2
MIGYDITLVPLAEQVTKLDQKVITPLYANDECANGPARCNAQIVKFLVKQGSDRGYFPEPDKSIHVCDDPAQLKETRRIFEEESLKLRFEAEY